jgi:hypothetical protein
MTAADLKDLGIPEDIIQAAQKQYEAECVAQLYHIPKSVNEHSSEEI